MSIFRKPSIAKIGLKVLGYGGFGVGKSTFGLSFPKIVAIDSEAGLSMYEGNPNILLIVNTSSVSDVEEGISEIEDMEGVGTFLIDSETKVYDSMQVSAMEVEEKRAKKKGGDVQDATVSVKGWGKIKLLNKKIQNLKIDLSSKGTHIVSISQMEDVKEKRGENFVKIGDKPSMAKGIEYDYDIVVKLFTETNTKGVEVYKGLVEKDRTGVFKKGDIIDNPSYDYWKSYCEKNADLQERTVSYSKDVEKDIEKMQEDSDKIDDLITEFKSVMKGLTKDNQVKVQKKLKDLGIENPLKTDNHEGMTNLLEYMKAL
jgi:hypothetical protein